MVISMPNPPNLMFALSSPCGCHENGVEFLPSDFRVLRGTYDPQTHMLSPGGVLGIDPDVIPAWMKPHRILAKTCGRQYGTVMQNRMLAYTRARVGTSGHTYTIYFDGARVCEIPGIVMTGGMDVNTPTLFSENDVSSTFDGTSRYVVNIGTNQFVLPISYDDEIPRIENTASVSTCVEKLIAVPFFSVANRLQRYLNVHAYHTDYRNRHHISEAERDTIILRISGFSGFTCNALNRDFELHRKPYGNDGALSFLEYESEEFTWTETVTMKTVGTDASGLKPVALPDELCSYYGPIVDVDVDLVFHARMTATISATMFRS